MEKYVFSFLSGATILITANNKTNAINILSNKYNRLYENDSWTITKVTIEINDKGEVMN